MTNYQYIISFLIIVPNILIGQNNNLPAVVGNNNIVPNPGFEQYDINPIGWYYNGDHFTKVMKYWSSPTGTSPDAYSPKAHIPSNWADKGFGKAKAHSGESFVGITTYGCENGKPHCREYLQIQLKEPLVVGQSYYVEFWLNHLAYTLRANNIGVTFINKALNLKTEELLSYAPVVNTNDIVIAKNLEWVKISGTFTAEAESEYMIIGNFFDDARTQVKQAWKDPLTFAYYYVDDVLVKKNDPVLPVPVKEDDLTQIPLAKGKVITLKDIYFEYNENELLPRSFVELDKLVNIMRENPTMQIEVKGHTDNIGKEKYNVSLSQKRAKSVMEYLNQQGISKERTRFVGLGSSKPIATNNTEEGRSKNRRVEFEITQL